LTRGSQRSGVTIVITGPKSPSGPGPDIEALVLPGRVSDAVEPHTGIYMGLAATGSRHSVVVLIFMPALKLAAGEP
jgi:hypothetical protein